MNFLKENNQSINPICFLYDDPTSPTLNLEEIKSYLENKINFLEVVIRKDFISHHINSLDIGETAKKFACCRVRSPVNKRYFQNPLIGEIRYEERILKRRNLIPSGVFYDGFYLDKVLRGLLSSDERNFFEHLHIVFSNRLFGTIDEVDKRYHARVIICGFPCIISTTGIIEAPAKSREFYMQKQTNILSNKNISYAQMKKELHDDFVDYEDLRLTEILKGYCLQALFYCFIGTPFCTSKHCRLYNAHWQKEVIDAQLNGVGLCAQHRKKLKELNKCLAG